MRRKDSLVCASLLCALLLTSFSTCPVQGVSLYPYGESVDGETIVEGGDETSSDAEQLTISFPFYGTSQSTVYVSFACHVAQPVNIYNNSIFE